jgi:hypothetical protein
MNSLGHSEINRHRPTFVLWPPSAPDPLALAPSEDKRPFELSLERGANLSSWTKASGAAKRPYRTLGEEPLRAIGRVGSLSRAKGHQAGSAVPL